MHIASLRMPIISMLPGPSMISHDYSSRKVIGSRIQHYLLDELIKGSAEGLADEQVGLSLVIIGRRGGAAVCEPAGLRDCLWGGLPGGIRRHKVGRAEHLLLQAGGILLACMALQGGWKVCVGVEAGHTHCESWSCKGLEQRHGR